MKPASFEYARPSTLDEAIRLLREQDGMAKLLAGGQSLVPMLNLRLAPAAMVIDISRLPDLAVATDTGDGVTLGACVTHAAIEDGLVPDATCGLLPCVAGGIAYRAIRNRGTLGGSLALADPSAEWPTVMVAVDAVIEARGPSGARRIDAAEFVRGPYVTVLDDEEILTSVTVPKLSDSVRWGFYKVCRKTGEYAASLGVAVLDPGRRVFRIVLGATGKPPLILHGTAEAARGIDRWSDEADRVLTEAVRGDLADLAGDLDPHQQQIHRTTAVRAVREAVSR